MVKNKIIPLNIVFTYPVHWDTFQILRDFVQNFYDSVEELSKKMKIPVDVIRAL